MCIRDSCWSGGYALRIHLCSQVELCFMKMVSTMARRAVVGMRMNYYLCTLSHHGKKQQQSTYNNNSHHDTSLFSRRSHNDLQQQQNTSSATMRMMSQRQRQGVDDEVGTAKNKNQNTNVSASPFLFGVDSFLRNRRPRLVNHQSNTSSTGRGVRSHRNNNNDLSLLDTTNATSVAPSTNGDADENDDDDMMLLMATPKLAVTTPDLKPLLAVGRSSRGMLLLDCSADSCYNHRQQPIHSSSTTTTHNYGVVDSITNITSMYNHADDDAMLMLMGLGVGDTNNISNNHTPSPNINHTTTTQPPRRGGLLVSSPWGGGGGFDASDFCVEDEEDDLGEGAANHISNNNNCLLYTSPSPRDS
eukprot:TRINITY_DN46104_c0_g1_i1.p1 TRINITY_DN46104_c0_g1~~TRINITY_DN46104_c0_g1_i1.p1  ORF type:complete len:359 (+),score=66.37 TRINITY_DN46104_c0_g1_i1:122-1198(+)